MPPVRLHHSLPRVQLGGGKSYQEPPCSQTCLHCCSPSPLDEDLSNPGLSTDPHGCWNHPSVCSPSCSKPPKLSSATEVL